LLHQGRARFYCSLRETKELVSLLEHDRENLICELERLRNYSWALYHAYDKAVGELEQGSNGLGAEDKEAESEEVTHCAVN
jgi:hypothetical protein